MKKVIETTLSGDMTSWAMGNIYGLKLDNVTLDERDGWKSGQKVRVTIESIEG
jgi:hypothetical protein